MCYFCTHIRIFPHQWDSGKTDEIKTWLAKSGQQFREMMETQIKDGEVPQPPPTWNKSSLPLLPRVEGQKDCKNGVLTDFLMICFV
jgi:hypothetical protein